MSNHVRRGDTVGVIAGRERGKRGKVLRVITEKNRVVVEKVNMIKKHQRPTQKARQGGIIEREIDFALTRLNQVRLAMRNPDFTTAKRVAAAINDFIGAPTAEPLDSSTVQVNVPQRFHGNVVALLTEIEQLQIEPDQPAKIVIDERSGIIVMGRDVRVATVAVAQGNLTVTISESRQVSQPNPLSGGRTVVAPRTGVSVTEDGKKFAVVKDGVSLQQLVDGLNGLGIGPRDLISILQAIKAAGAIEADIEVM